MAALKIYLGIVIAVILIILAALYATGSFTGIGSQLWRGGTQSDVGKCSDTDGGSNIGVKGTCTDNTPPPLQTKSMESQSFDGKVLSLASFADTCVTNNTVREYYCSSNKCRNTVLPCGAGNVCQNGACVTPPPNQAPNQLSIMDSPDPVTSGSTITFNSSWTDPEGNQARVYICRNNNFGNCNAYCSSGLGFSPRSCGHTPLVNSTTVFTYYSFVQDSAGGVSNMLNGTFTVNPAVPNQAPNQLSIMDSPDPVTIGSYINFTSTWTDPQEGDLATLFICRDSTFAACNAYCSAGPAASPTSCRYLASANGTNVSGTNFYYSFVRDTNGALSNMRSGSFVINP